MAITHKIPTAPAPWETRQDFVADRSIYKHPDHPTKTFALCGDDVTRLGDMELMRRLDEVLCAWDEEENPLSDVQYEDDHADDELSPQAVLVQQGRLIEAGALTEGATQITGARFHVESVEGGTRLVFQWTVDRDGKKYLTQEDITIPNDKRLDTMEFDFTDTVGHMEAVAYVRGLRDEDLI